MATVGGNLLQRTRCVYFQDVTKPPPQPDLEPQPQREREPPPQPDLEPQPQPQREPPPQPDLELQLQPQLIADVALIAIGHLPSVPLGGSAEVAEFASRHGLTYLAENYAADVDLSRFGAGQDVIVRGFGLAFIDLMVLLTEGRGGTYREDDDGRLTYVPSGREPRLHVGSRRGVPYRSKLTYNLQAPPAPHLRFLTSEVVDRLLTLPRPTEPIEANGPAGDDEGTRGGQVDIARDVWPLLVKEILFGYYHELFHGHPDRVRLSWRDFEVALAETSSPELPAVIADAVPDPADRFDLGAFDRPLQGRTFRDSGELQDWMRAHIESDLARRSDPRHSADLGAFNALLAVLVPAFRLMSSPRVSMRSRLVDASRFRSFFGYFASGPPPRRLRELLALSSAGVLNFLGADTSVICSTGADTQPGPSNAAADTKATRPNETAKKSAAGGKAATSAEAADSDSTAGREGAAFVASSPGIPGVVRARALIEARVPRTSLGGSAEPLVQHLYEQGELGEEHLMDDDGLTVGTGRVLVDSDCHIIDAEGRVHPRRYAFGAWTSAATAAAFSRPRTNSPFFQQNDAAARDVLKLLLQPSAKPGRQKTVSPPQPSDSTPATPDPTGPDLQDPSAQEIRRRAS